MEEKNWECNLLKKKYSELEYAEIYSNARVNKKKVHDPYIINSYIYTDVFIIVCMSVSFCTKEKNSYFDCCVLTFNCVIYLTVFIFCTIIVNYFLSRF